MLKNLKTNQNRIKLSIKSIWRQLVKLISKINNKKNNMNKEEN